MRSPVDRRQLAVCLPIEFGIWPARKLMRDWNLRADRPMRFTLAVDARLCAPEYCDDQIWELSIGDGEPPGVSLRTTFGLRARGMRMLPRFREGDAAISDPQRFANPPVIQRFFPNYLALTYSPFPGIDVVQEQWVPENRIIAGRLRIANSGVTPRQMALEWVALLSPNGDGQPMAPERIQGVRLLQGRTENLAPVLFATGGAEASSSPYPALTQEWNLLPGAMRRWSWVQCAFEDPEVSFEQARQTAARNWDAEFARIELINSTQVEIETGDPDWDTAFAFGQQAALGLIHGPSEHLPERSFVITRRPDQGFSLRGDGTDYDHLWNGQTTFDTWYLIGIILPAAPEIAKGLLRNFLAVQNKLGYADWKPGLGGQLGRLDAMPLLATIALEIVQATEDVRFAEEVFPDLLTFVLSWFGPYHDRDGDGIPEWDHPAQAGFENHPLFSYWEPGARGVDITTAENPSLCGFLFRECGALIRLAERIQRPEAIPALESLQDNLRSAVTACWDPSSGIHRYWDRDTHTVGGEARIARITGPGERRFRQQFSPAARFLMRVQIGRRGAPDSPSRSAQITIHGRNAEGNPTSETLKPAAFRWLLDQGIATTQGCFSSLHRIEVEAIRPADVVLIDQVNLDLEDHSLLTPIWAGLANGETIQALLRGPLRDPARFGRPHGIPACPACEFEEGSSLGAVWLPWNALLIEGLAQAGYPAAAAEIFRKIMAAAAGTLARDGAFRSHYHPDTGEGQGERNALGGLPPLGTFLKTLGIRLISPWRVALEGRNPYPWPVRVKYRGLVIARGLEETSITFPSGQSIVITDPQPCIVDGRVAD